MMRMLEVEDLSFQLQLKDAVSIQTRSRLICQFHPPHPQISTKTSLCCQGFTDTSLTVREAAAVLRNYERRTGDVLKRRDLREGTLQDKLIPADYDIKGQVLPLVYSNCDGYSLPVCHLKTQGNVVISNLDCHSTQMSNRLPLSSVRFS